MSKRGATAAARTATAAVRLPSQIRLEGGQGRAAVVRRGVGPATARGGDDNARGGGGGSGAAPLPDTAGGRPGESGKARGRNSPYRLNGGRQADVADDGSTAPSAAIGQNCD
uniref:Uncharacterized protein n=1 Tax=Oryza sativa subsp. japonica TaxID=39947 RepID=Q6K630_ORYSJ|nr:hypothetical protein [Oryza sativa Japonica Group]